MNDRSDDRAARHRTRTASRSTCATSGRPSARFRRRCSTSVTSDDVHASSTPTSSTATSAGSRCTVPTGDRFAWEDGLDLHPQSAVLRGHHAGAAPLARHHRRARARAARRQHHDRSHLAGRIDQDGQPGREVPDRARRAAEGLQLLRRAARQPRSDDARHVRQRPPAQPAGARHRRRLDDAISPDGERDDDLRRGDEVPGRQACRCSCSPARNTARGRRATGRPRARCCSACKAVIAESFERIHRSNLVNMGVLPLQFHDGAVGGVARPDRPRALRARRHRARAAAAAARSPSARRRRRARSIEFEAVVRIDTPEELVAFRHGGILPYVLRQLVGEELIGRRTQVMGTTALHGLPTTTHDS